MKRTLWQKIKDFITRGRVIAGIDYANGKDKTVKIHFYKNSDDIVKILRMEVLGEKE